MNGPGLTCCERGRTCAEIRWTDGRDMMPPQERAGFTIIADMAPDSPHGVDYERTPIAFCPFCGTKIEAT